MHTDIINFYNYHLKKYGKDDIRAMGWHDEDEYSVRFEIATAIADLNNSSILDVGCGFGGLYKFLISNQIKAAYLGIDIVPKMIEIAREKNPTGKFKVADLFTEELGKFDYVFCIGALNVTTPNSDLYFRKMLNKMISLARRGVVINFLSKKFYLSKGPYHFEDAKKLKSEIETEYKVKVRIVEDKRLTGESCLFIIKN